MSLDDNRIDVVASVACGMPVYYRIPDAISLDAGLLPIVPRAAAGVSRWVGRLWAVIETRLVAARG